MPRLLQLEGGVVLMAVVAACLQLGWNWWLFARLFLAPDLSMPLYLKDQRWGAASYNARYTHLVHKNA